MNRLAARARVVLLPAVALWTAVAAPTPLEPAGAPPSADGLVAAARDGDAFRVEHLLHAGADVDGRHREHATALDAAERHGQHETAALLRRWGARGSGKSLGDTVCVRPWAGHGFCGTVEDRDGPRFRLRVDRLVGCTDGCAPNVECSGARPVGGPAAGAVRAGVSLVVPSWCLTHTAVERIR